MNKILATIWDNKFSFFGTFFAVFTLSYLLLVAVDFLPEPIEETEVETSEGTKIEETEEIAEIATEAEVVAEPSFSVMPTKISIEKLNKSITVLNPTSRTIADLDNALLEGVVRHPDSAHLAQDGNVFILGHSSYLPNVYNKNFQAFNGIQNLEWGDEIRVESEDAVYFYRVEKVYRAQAQELVVPIAGDEKLLTLATCNSFGSIDDRYIVEAKQVRVESL